MESRNPIVKVLLVEDDKNLCFILQSTLEDIIGNYRVTVASNGQEGLEMLAAGVFDIIVSDVEMPLLNGTEMVRQIRLTHPDLPILFITGMTNVRDVINGYQSGADMYIKKPFLPEELDAHIQALLKLRHPESNTPVCEEEKTVFHIGKYRFSLTQRTLSFGNENWTLTKRESEILERLCQHKNEVVNRDKLLAELWGTTDFYASRSLDVFVTKLRKYLSLDPDISLKTLKSIGLCLSDKPGQKCPF